MRRTPDPGEKIYARVTRDIAKAASAALSAFGVVRSFLRGAHPSLSKVVVKLLDSASAHELATVLRSYAGDRLTSGYYRSIDPKLRTWENTSRDPDSTEQQVVGESAVAASGNSVTVPFEFILPPEALDHAATAGAKSAAFLSLLDTATTLHTFVRAFRQHRVLGIRNQPPAWPGSEAALDCHTRLLEFCELILVEASDVKPSHFEVFSDRGVIHLRVDGDVIDVPRKQMLALVAASRVRYDRWFSVKDFCKDAFGSDVDASRDWNNAFAPLKKTSALDWDTDALENRRLLNVVITCECSEAEVTAFLPPRKP